MNRKLIGVAIAGGLALTLASPSRSAAKPPPPLKGPIATVGDRTVEAIDIVQAAKVLAGRAGRDTTPGSWRRYLMNRCIDRELLAMEAARRGFTSDPGVLERIRAREYPVLMGELLHQDLIPDITPSPTEFAEIKGRGLYTYIDLYYILVRDGPTGGRRTLADRIAERARGGGSWDSLARLYSGHPPSAAAGGHFGATLVRDIEPAAHAAVLAGEAGDVFGPYSGPFGHEVYKLGGFIPMDDDSLMRLLVDERRRALWTRNQDRLLKKYRFTPDATASRLALRVLASETPEAILASLGPDGTRPKHGSAEPLGVIARTDLDSVTIRDVLLYDPPPTNERMTARIDTEEALAQRAGRLLIPRLLIRDARERGLDEDPAVARTLRLIRDEEATRAMVERERPKDPDDAEMRAYIDSHAARYRRPVARLATVIMFPNADSARAVLRTWNGVGLPPDATLAGMGFRRRPGAGVTPPTAGFFSIHTLYEDSADPLSLGVRGLDSGKFAPVISLPQGWAVVYVSDREESRAMTEEEAAPRALRDWREEAENRWVTGLLERLRAKTAVKVVPSRLDAVRLQNSGSKVGTGP